MAHFIKTKRWQTSTPEKLSAIDLIDDIVPEITVDYDDQRCLENTNRTRELLKFLVEKLYDMGKIEESELLMLANSIGDYSNRYSNQYEPSED